MQNSIDDINGIFQNEEGDLSPADMVEFSMQVIANAMKFQETAQNKIDANVANHADDFGADISERQLKGE